MREKATEQSNKIIVLNNLYQKFWHLEKIKFTWIFKFNQNGIRLIIRIFSYDWFLKGLGEISLIFHVCLKSEHDFFFSLCLFHEEREQITICAITLLLLPPSPTPRCICKRAIFFCWMVARGGGRNSCSLICVLQWQRCIFKCHLFSPFYFGNMWIFYGAPTRMSY